MGLIALLLRGRARLFVDSVSLCKLKWPRLFVVFVGFVVCVVGVTVFWFDFGCGGE